MIPKISIIIPNYNHANYLDKRIESILQQTYQDFEIILMDDCSTDDSRTILNKYMNHARISKVLFNSKNSGSTFKQWQKGINEAQGQYIWIAESDDYADKRLLETLGKQLDSHPSVGLAYCQSWAIDESNSIIRSCKEMYPFLPGNIVHNGREVIKNYMAGSNLIPNASAVVFKREIALQVNSDYTQFKFSGDWWFWCELLLRSDIIHICEELNYFRFHLNKVSISSARKGLYFTEGLTILNLIKRKANLPEEIFINKTKNWALNFIQIQLESTSRLSYKTALKVIWRSIEINKLFIVRVVYLLFRRNFNLFKVR